ncbi:crotonase/enoyl-CoA hydratase family protein [Alteromonas hispanica]|uniref:Crotonase/enoyl-CoA hydratase family protein n=1 Tax=Alteromonas hispanica TaxID=315421 RepID=A0A6L9MTS9_9ALTE|nr:crotonase/enoyl-CoA hydratase family protein [Alteromonas hispanica]NDW21659.1 crotonase/enoyl-CoA hydratase family protein [Alteromonas hispanica]
MAFDFKIENDIALITFDDGKVNAVGFNLIEQFNKALDEAEQHANAVVFHGGEGKFCGGFDLSVMKSGDEEKQNKLVQAGADLIVRLYGYPLPVIVAAEGHSIALGAIMLMAADLRIGKDGGTKYGLNETAIGMVLPPFGMELAKARLSLTSQTEALLFSRIFEGKEAVKAGFLDAAVPQDQVLRTAMGYAEKLKMLPRAAFAESKIQLRKATIEKMKG